MRKIMVTAVATVTAVAAVTLGAGVSAAQGNGAKMSQSAQGSTGGRTPTKSVTRTAGKTTLCSTVGAHMFVDHGRYAIRTPNWHGHGPLCVQNRNQGSNFYVTQMPTSQGQIVEAFPSIMYGCYWGVCTEHNKLPMQVSKIKSLHSTYSVRTRTEAQANSSFDIWFGKRPHAQGKGHVNGAELMVFLNHFGGCCALANVQNVTAGKHKYDLMHWTAFDPATKDHAYRAWTYIQFRMKQQVHAVHHFNLLKLIKIAVHEHLIKPSWYLLNVEGGFEVWHGGVLCPKGKAGPHCGLAAKDFSVTIHGHSAIGKTANELTDRVSANTSGPVVMGPALEFN